MHPRHQLSVYVVLTKQPISLYKPLLGDDGTCPLEQRIQRSMVASDANATAIQAWHMTLLHKLRQLLLQRSKAGCVVDEVVDELLSFSTTKASNGANLLSTSTIQRGVGKTLCCVSDLLMLRVAVVLHRPLRHQPKALCIHPMHITLQQLICPTIIVQIVSKTA